MIHTHAALRWDGMQWPMLLTYCISMETNTLWVSSAAHPILSRCVYECTM